MKKLLLTLACLLLLASPVFASTVTSMETQCTVGESGACTVVITAQVSFEQVEESFLVPLPANARQISVNGYSYRRTRVNGYQCLRLSAPNGFSGSQSITLSYTLPSAAVQSGSGQVLTLPLLCPEWSCKISGYTLSVTMPKAFDALPVFESGYYGALIDNYMDIHIDGTLLTASLSQELMDHESLSLSMELADDYFDLRYASGKSATLDLAMFWALFVLCIGFWAVLLRGKLFLPRVQAMPPAGSIAGAVPCQLLQEKADLAQMLLHWASLGYLYISCSKSGKLTLTRLMEMGNERKPYEIAAFDALFRDGDVISGTGAAYRAVQETAERSATAYWQGKLFRGGTLLTRLLRLLALCAGLFAGLLCFDTLLPAVSSRWVLIVLLLLPWLLSSYLVQRLPSSLFCKKHLYRAVPGLAGFAVLLILGAVSGSLGMTLLHIVLQLLIGTLTLFGTRRTKVGQTFLEELLGLRRYLRTLKPEDTQALLADNPLYYYRTLPYALALGVGRIFSLHFGAQKMETCGWLVFEGGTPKTALGFCKRCEQVLDTLRGDRISYLLRRLRTRRKPS